MEKKAEAFFNSLKGKKVAFIGCGRSNLPLTRLFLRYGANVTVFDEKDEAYFAEAAAELRSSGIKLRSGEGCLNELDAEMVFRTPGFYYNRPEIAALRSRGIVVTSEMEVFFDLCPCKIYGVTGTDGKTTTTTIISEILKRAGKAVHVGGNIGTPLLPLIEQISSDDVAVAELSSFQLQSMRRSPDTAVVTNIYPDHLNVHKDMTEYTDAKKNVLLHQNAFSRAVLNMDNAETDALSDIVRGDLYKFSVLSRPERGGYLGDDGWLRFTDGKTDQRIVYKDAIRIPGMHNIENYLAAICAVYADVPIRAIADTAASFGGVEHRIEFVRELSGVRFYNDTIATSPASVRAGLRAFNQRIIAIAGGSDKELDYSELAQDLCGFVKVLILLGETADKIEAAVKGYKEYDERSTRIIRVKSLPEAVDAAYRSAQSGDIVSLSPASASFDMFRDFEERGRVFKSLVNSL